MLRRFAEDVRGTTAIEYGMIIVCLSLAIVAGIGTFGNSMNDMFMNPSRMVHGTLNR